MLLLTLLSHSTTAFFTIGNKIVYSRYRFKKLIQCHSSLQYLNYSSVFDSCVKDSGLEMFFHHKPTGQICGGRTLGACVLGDFCDQSRNNAKISPEPKNIPVVPEMTDYSQKSTVPQPLTSREEDRGEVQFRAISVEDQSTEVICSSGKR